MTLGDLAQRLDCTLHDGDATLAIDGVAGMEQARPGQITFLANPKYAPKVKNCQASAILAAAPIPGMATLISKNPYHDFARALGFFYQPPRPEPGIHPMASIHASAVLGEGAAVGPFVAVGASVKIGRNAVLHPHVTIYEGVTIGDDFLAHSHATVREFCHLGNGVVLQNGAVIGGDGFGFAKTSDGRQYKIVQSGVVVLEDDVEVQALSAVDRATMGETRVKRGAKIDNLVQVGHASVVGEDNIICSQVGLAGSTILGKSVLLAGQVGVSGHLTIHDNAIAYAQSGIGHDVPAGALVSGSPAFDNRTWRRAVTAFQKLPELLRRVRELENRLAELEHGEKHGR